ncbi:hypothetical protein OHA72_63765 [Dactylosporangium sp. NBC_01737]|uniref:hypothetical protein n=1 Tax=Dactylosporangium sp. NBC_01737 TaxID=2975959 RepID=UPI002E116A05|nr:hypothetical protein OHA72_63765 [Dactylosporangium sp. NBC_01737]
MAQGDWVPDEADQPWLPDFDVRTLVAGLPHGPVSLDDPRLAVLNDHGAPLAEIRAAMQGLGDDDPTAVWKALTALGWRVCSDGNTAVSGAVLVPSLIRIAADRAFAYRIGVLQLVGDLARTDGLRMEMRPWMLRAAQPVPVYDHSGYQENWSVDAVRVMVGRDARLLIDLLGDDDPAVRGLAAYVLVTALPVIEELTGTLRSMLDVEGDPAVRMILVICLAQHDRELDRVPEALEWTQALWSDAEAPLEIRLGGATAWLNLTTAAVPPQLQRLRDEVPMSDVIELARHLPWISWLTDETGGLEAWWRRQFDEARLD